jgi:hypothetical protein
MLFINYKLFLVVRKSRKNKRTSSDMKKTLWKIYRVDCW